MKMKNNLTGKVQMNENIVLKIHFLKTIFGTID